MWCFRSIAHLCCYPVLHNTTHRTLVWERPCIRQGNQLVFWPQLHLVPHSDTVYLCTCADSVSRWSVLCEAFKGVFCSSCISASLKVELSPHPVLSSWEPFYLLFFVFEAACGLCCSDWFWTPGLKQSSYFKLQDSWYQRCHSSCLGCKSPGISNDNFFLWYAEWWPIHSNTYKGAQFSWKPHVGHMLLIHTYFQANSSIPWWAW